MRAGRDFHTDDVASGTPRSFVRERRRSYSRGKPCPSGRAATREPRCVRSRWERSRGPPDHPWSKETACASCTTRPKIIQRGKASSPRLDGRCTWRCTSSAPTSRERVSRRCSPAGRRRVSRYVFCATGSAAGRLRVASFVISFATAARCATSTRRACSTPSAACAGTIARSSASTVRRHSSPGCASPIPGWAMRRRASRRGATSASSCADLPWPMSSTRSPAPGGRRVVPFSTKCYALASQSRPRDSTGSE